ncbi:MAG: hypothetical protein EKK62_12875 [Acidimicrobiia bacterium]|nr:MAG: hypothetical protein EKK62_12875 [Acidimicrobiia bacterium]
MTRAEAMAVLRDVAGRASVFFADARIMGNQLLVDLTPRAMVNASNAIVVLPGCGETAASFPKAGSEAQISELVIARSARRAA